MNVVKYLLEAKDPLRIAFTQLDASYSFGDLNALICDAASRLTGAGLDQGDRVLIIAENSAFWAGAYLGTLFAGLVAVPVPVGIRSSDLQSIIKSTGACHAFCSAAAVKRHAAELSSTRVTTDLRVSFNERAPGAVDVDDDQLAAIVFTSGSTAAPRGVLISHRNIEANTRSIIEALLPSEADRMLVLLPFSYSFGASLLHTHLRVGGSLVIENRFAFPELVVRRLLESRCTGIAGVPSHFQILLRSSTLPTTQFPFLKTVQQAGGHLAPVFVRELQRALPATNIYLMYGQTEATARLTVLSPALVSSKPGSIGKPIPGVEISLVDSDGKEVGVGEIGEIIARGENIARGYWQNPEATCSRFRNGWLHTNDLARSDSEGFLFVCDRIEEFVKCGGTRVSCCEIEDRIAECSEVSEVAVIGIPDEVLGEAVKAFVVFRAGGAKESADKLRAFCRKELPSLLNPREIVVLGALPKNSSGKVSKVELREGRRNAHADWETYNASWPASMT